VARVTDLPDEVRESPLVTEIGTSSFPMIEVGLAGTLPYRQLRELAKRLEKKLENVEGVSHLNRFGFRAREIRVELEPDKINQRKISMAEVIAAIRGRNIRATGGSFESYTSEKNIVTLAQFRDPQEVGDVIVRATFDGPLIKIRDLAVIHDDFEDANVLSRVKGQSAISFIAFKSASADIIRTVEKIKALVEQEKTYLPPGVQLLVSNDESNYVRNRFSIVIANGLIGLTLVMIVLALFLNVRVAFWVAVGIPIALLGTIFLLPVFDTFIDSVTLTAMVLVLGIIVDDAIIISENIYQHHERGAPPLEAAAQGVAEVYKPVITTIFTTFVAFAPLFFMPGMLGKFVFVIPLVITLALAVSLIESSLALPAHIASGLAHHSRTSRRLVDALKDLFRALLTKLLRFRYSLIIVFLLGLAGALLFAMRFMDFVLFPSSTAERFLIMIETPVGSSLQATSDRTKELEKLVAGLSKQELNSFVTRIGTFGDIGSSERENNAAIFVSLTPYASRARTADEIVEELRGKGNGIAGIESVHFMIDAGGPPVGRPILIRVVGADNAMRKRLADDVEAYLNTLKGTKDIDRDDKGGKQQVEIKLDYDKLARVGISVSDVAQNVRIAYDGEVVTSVRYGDEDVDFRVIFPEHIRQIPDYLSQLYLPNKEGNLTQLGKLARFENVPGPANIRHYKADRSINVSGDVDTKQTTALKVSQKVQSHFNVDKDYPGMRLAIGGKAEESRKSMVDLFIILGIAAVGIYVLLVLLFNSLWQPFMVMMAIPFGMVGVIIAFALHHEPLGFLAMTGIIGLSGVVVNDSLVLVDHVNRIRRQYANWPMLQVVLQATTDRFRAIILTTVSTVAGLLPLAYGIGGSDPYMGPMALALGWGLLFATPLTLVLLPCLYLASHDIAAVVRRLSNRIWSSQTQ